MELSGSQQTRFMFLRTFLFLDFLGMITLEIRMKIVKKVNQNNIDQTCILLWCQSTFDQERPSHYYILMVIYIYWYLFIL